MPPCKFFLSLWILLAAFFALRPLDDVDLFTQIRIGTIALESGWYRIEKLSYMLEDAPVQNPGEFAQIVFAQCVRIGGLRGLKLINVLLFSGGIVLALYLGAATAASHLQTMQAGPLLASSLLMCAALASQSSARPQSFAVLFFPLALMLIRRPATAARIGALAAVFWLWQGCHPSALVMIPVVFVSAIFRFRQAAPYALSFLSLFLPPHDVSSVFLARQNASISRQLLQISEWMPPWHPSVSPAMTGPLVLLIALLILSPSRFKAIDRADVALSALFLGLSLYSARFTLFFALHAATVLPALFSDRRQLRLFKRLSLSRFLSPVALCLSLAFAPLVSPEIPAFAINMLRQRVPSGRIYNYREWAGPLHWFGAPCWRSGLDGRLYLFSRELWRSYEREAAGLISLEELVKKHKPDAFFLHPSYHKALIEKIRISPDWSLFSQGPEHVAFVGPTARAKS